MVPNYQLIYFVIETIWLLIISSFIGLLLRIKEWYRAFYLLYLRISRCSMSICFGEVKNPDGMYWVKTIKRNFVLRKVE